MFSANGCHANTSTFPRLVIKLLEVSQYSGHQFERAVASEELPEFSRDVALFTRRH